MVTQNLKLEIERLHAISMDVLYIYGYIWEFVLSFNHFLALIKAFFANVANVCINIFNTLSPPTCSPSLHPYFEHIMMVYF